MARYNISVKMIDTFFDMHLIDVWSYHHSYLGYACSAAFINRLLLFSFSLYREYLIHPR